MDKDKYKLGLLSPSPKQAESQPMDGLDENMRPEIQVPEYLDVPLEEYQQLMEEMHRELDAVSPEGDESILRRDG